MILHDAKDVTPEILHEAEMALDWSGDGPMDWEQFIDRLADAVVVTEGVS